MTDVWEELRENGRIRIASFVIELSLDMGCPCEDDEMFPSIVVYDDEIGEYYYVDEDFEPVANFRGAWEQAIEVLAAYAAGLKKPRLKRSPRKEAPPEVVERFLKAIRGLGNQ